MDIDMERFSYYVTLFGGILLALGGFGQWYFKTDHSPNKPPTTLPKPYPKFNHNPKDTVINVKGKKNTIVTGQDNIVVNGNKNKIQKNKVENNDNSVNKSGNSVIGNNNKVDQSTTNNNYYGPVARQLTPTYITRLDAIPAGYTISMYIETGTNESKNFGDEVFSYLRYKGYKVIPETSLQYAILFENPNNQKDASESFSLQINPEPYRTALIYILRK